tara:strand:+ start:56 stop:190 length:135 start_codon:yes stop_codon:yes gene_type:complete
LREVVVEVQVEVNLKITIVKDQVVQEQVDLEKLKAPLRLSPQVP